MLTHEEKGSDIRYRLGGARADFVASLGRKIADARTILLALENARGSAHLRDELLRRLATLAQGAKLLRFEAMEEGLAETLAVIHRAAHEGEVSIEDTQIVGRVLEDLPALAWGESPRRGAKESEEPPAVAQKESDAYTALVVGVPSIGDALTYHDPDGLTFSCECTSDAQAGIDVARALAPDVIVLDADIPYAPELTEALLDDPMTEPVPVIVIGSFHEPGSKETFVAMGVTRVLTKPLPHERLRRACEETIFGKEGRTMRVVLGEPTVQQLGERLADEVRLALVNAVEESMRGQRVPLGEGTEVLGAVWGAIARVREVVTARTSGMVRFSSLGPEGAIALAPSLDTGAGLGLRGAGHQRGASAADVRLAGRTVLVCDDDPGVVWFISDLLKAAGCNVVEAHDGAEALELAWKTVPDVVVTDILMPKMDGFALTRRLKRDVVLRDVPVVLLSWKEDLLQRVRELGAGAAAYLRKESDARAIVSRIREALRAKTRVEARLRSEGEVRGRLDGITVRALLDTVCRTRDCARVSVRDASFLYEVEIRDGAPARATRTTGDGSFMSGPKVLSAMLGIGAARFIVSPSTAVVQPELVGELVQQLARPVALARAAQGRVFGAELLKVASIRFDDEALKDYLRATPQIEKAILVSLNEGISPRELCEQGTADLGLLEDLLLDLSARGVVTAIETPKGVDVLGPAVEAALKLVDARARGLIGATPSPVAAHAIIAKVTAKAASEGDSEDAAIVLEKKKEMSPPTSTPAAPASESTRVPTLDGLGAPPVAPMLPIGSFTESDATDVENTFFGHAPMGDDDRAGDENEDDDDGERSALGRRVDEAVSVSIRIEEPSMASAQVRLDTPLESVKVQDDAGTRSEPKRWPLLLGLTTAVGVAGLAFWLGGGVRAVHPSDAAQATPPAQEAPTEDLNYVDLPAGTRIEPGQGVLEITNEGKESVRVDGLDRGATPSISLPLWSGNHDVRIGTDDDHPRIVEVRSGKIARLRVGH